MSHPIYRSFESNDGISVLGLLRVVDLVLSIKNIVIRDASCVGVELVVRVHSGTSKNECVSTGIVLTVIVFCFVHLLHATSLIQSYSICSSCFSLSQTTRDGKFRKPNSTSTVGRKIHRLFNKGFLKPRSWDNDPSRKNQYAVFLTPGSHI